MKKLLILITISISLQACSGLEIGGRLGVYRVDQRQESQRTNAKPVPLKCYFTSCDTALEDVQGS